MSEKKSRVNDESFVVCWQKHEGNVQEVAKELEIKENTARLRAHKYISSGVKLTPPKRKSRKVVDRVDFLNSLISQ